MIAAFAWLSPTAQLLAIAWTCVFGGVFAAVVVAERLWR